nr:uncharacterized protein LOC128693153 [Cherax quadricarinatus]
MSYRVSMREGADKHVATMSRRFLFFWKTKARTKKKTEIEDLPKVKYVAAPSNEESCLDLQKERRDLDSQRLLETPTRVKIVSASFQDAVTPEELIRKNVQARTSLEIKMLLKESINAEPVRALCDHLDLKLPGALLFKKGEVIKVLGEDDSGLCRGVIFDGSTSARTGVFPTSLVARRDTKVPSTKEMPSTSGINNMTIVALPKYV